MDINVYFHDTEVTKLLKKILKREDTIMATVQELNESMSAIVPIIDKVSADTDKLIEQLASVPPGGLTPEQQEALDAAQATATTILSRLQAIDDKVPDSVSNPEPTN